MSHPTQKAVSLQPNSPSSLLRLSHLVEPIFEALSLCAALHPDPNDDGGEEGDWVDDGEGGFETFDGTGEEELSEVGRVRSDFSTPSTRFQPY